MKFYNRNGMLYVRINGTRVSTKLKDTKENRKLFESYAKNDEFFEKFDVSKKQKTVLDFCIEILAEKEKVLKGTTMETYYSFFSSRIKPYFENKYPQEIRPKHVLEFYKTFTDKATLATVVSILKASFERAIIEEHIKTSPFVIKLPSIKSNYEINPFNLKEIELILSKADGWFKNFIAIAFFTGMRTGEILALKWDCVDLEESTINIIATRTKGFTQTPKTKSSIRIIDIISQAEYYLKEQRKLTGLGELVFSNFKGKILYGAGALRYQWVKLLESCNLEFRSIYQTRHTFASNMLSNKEDIVWVSSMLGHRSSSITYYHYTKYIRTQRTKKETFLDKNFDGFCTKLAQ